jgi:hypothetical protein
MSHGPINHNAQGNYNTNAPIRTADVTPGGAVDPDANKRCRHFMFTFNGSLRELAENPSLATCTSASDGTTAQLFGIAGLRDITSQVREGDLRSVRVKDLIATKQHSTFSVPMAMDIAGIRGNYYSINGDRTALQVFPGISSAHETLMAPSPLLESEFAAQYPTITAANLTTKGITRMPSGMHLVEANHPVIGMIRMNPEVMNTKDSLDAVRMVEGCYPISEETVQYVIGALHNEVCARIPDIDWSSTSSQGAFGASLRRADGEPLLSTKGLSSAAALDVPSSLSVVVRVNYQLPNILG